MGKLLTPHAKEEDKLQHDVKRLSIGIKLIAEEESETKRKYLFHLMDLEVKKILEDIDDMLEKSGG